MKANNVALISLSALLSIGAVLYAERESADERPYIGIILDHAELPCLLVKHLHLSSNQGIRIRNVHRGSPADKAGLERDDIITGFQGEEITGRQAFVEAVRQAGAGTEVSLEIIHLGTRKTIKLKLEALDLKGERDWKYPPEPEVVQSWRPGKMFRLGPSDNAWMEVPFGKTFSDDATFNLLNILKGVYSYQYSEGDESYTITIEGDPEDEDTTVTVRVSTPEYKTTVKKIDELPKKYRASAREALRSARRFCGKERMWNFPAPCWPEQERWKDSYGEKARPFYPHAPPSEPEDSTSEQMKEWMRKLHELQERIEQLEKQQREMLDHPWEAPKYQGPREPNEPIQPENTQMQA